MNEEHTIILRGRDPILDAAIAEELRRLRHLSGAMGVAIVRRVRDDTLLLEAVEMDRALLHEGEEVTVTGAQVLPSLRNRAPTAGRLENDLLTFAPLHGLVLVPFEADHDPTLAVLLFAAPPLRVSEDAIVLATRALETLLVTTQRYADQIRRLSSTLVQVEYASDRDVLTHALNRRGFISLLRKLSDEWCHRPATYAIIVADLDHLKEVNDTEGHAAGDALLVRFVEILRANLREPDYVGRLGGDEFAVVAKLRSSSDTQLVLDRLRAALDAARVDAALGAASQEVPMPLEELLVAADHAMYEDKTRRRQGSLRETAPHSSPLFDATLPS